MAINQSVGDKTAIKSEIGDKSAINYKDKILEYLSNHSVARSQDIALFIGLLIVSIFFQSKNVALNVH